MVWLSVGNLLESFSLQKKIRRFECLLQFIKSIKYLSSQRKSSETLLNEVQNIIIKIRIL